MMRGEKVRLRPKLGRTHDAPSVLPNMGYLLRVASSFALRMVVSPADNALIKANLAAETVFCLTLACPLTEFSSISNAKNGTADSASYV